VLRRELGFGMPKPDNNGVKLAADLGMLGPSDACGGYGHARQRTTDSTCSRRPIAGGYGLTLGGSGSGLHGSPGTPSGGSGGETLRLGTGWGALPCGRSAATTPSRGSSNRNVGSNNDGERANV
jgi:hypothetical protein